MRKKIYLSLLLIATMSLSIVGCGKNETKTEKAPTIEMQEPSGEIAMNDINDEETIAENNQEEREPINLSSNVWSYKNDITETLKTNSIDENGSPKKIINYYMTFKDGQFKFFNDNNDDASGGTYFYTTGRAALEDAVLSLDNMDGDIDKGLEDLKNAGYEENDIVCVTFNYDYWTDNGEQLNLDKEKAFACYIGLANEDHSSVSFVNDNNEMFTLEIAK